MIRREIESEIKKLANKIPVICITGSRQSGKTTLVKYLFPDFQYYNLEFPEHRQFAQIDPSGLLSKIEAGIIIDEIQRVPELLSSIQYFVDEKKIKGKVIITGSQNLLLMQSVSQTLAGRVALFTLQPFSISELQNTKYKENDYENYLVKGFYPRIYDENLDVNIWMQDYINTYIERDVRQITTVKDLSLFSKFLHLCAGHTGQIINYSTFSNNLGIDVNTVKSWLSILETSYIIFLQTPWFRNINKRLIKSPRLFFYDTGLACNLLGIKSTVDFSNHYLKGGLFESFVISELYKYIYNRKLNTSIYFLRDSNGNEIDVLFEFEGRIKAIEIKSGSTIIPGFFKGFKYLDNHLKGYNIDNYLVYGGSNRQDRSNELVLGWKDLNEVFQT